MRGCGKQAHVAVPLLCSLPAAALPMAARSWLGNWRLALLGCAPVVEVHGGAVGVVGVHHRADAGSEEGHAVILQWQPQCDVGLGQ